MKQPETIFVITLTASAMTIRFGAILNTLPKQVRDARCAAKFFIRNEPDYFGYVGGLPGVHAMWAGADWTWHKPVLRAKISTNAYLKDLIEHQTRFAGRAIQQIYHVEFFNQGGDLVAEADSWCFRTDRDEARERGTKYEEVKAKPQRRYSDEELETFYQLYANEEVRGSKPRYWEDVTEGEELRPLASPMTVTGFIAYAQGWGGLYIELTTQLAPDLRPSWPWHKKSVWHPRLPRARSLGRSPAWSAHLEHMTTVPNVALG